MAKITSISTLGWAHYTLYEALPRIHERGFVNVEIASFDGYCFHCNSGSPVPAELKGMLSTYGMAPAVFHYSRGRRSAWKADDIEDFIDTWKRKIPDVREIGFPMMSMVCGERNTRSDQDEQLRAVAAAFDKVAEFARGFGITMLLEIPHVYSVIPRPAQVYQVLDHLQSDNIGVLVDSSHWGVIGYDIDEFLDRIGDRIRHVHLRDSRGPDTADRRQELELTPGKGSVDFRAFGAALDRIGYSGGVSLEFEYRDMTLPAIDDEYDFGLAYLVSCGWELPETVKYEQK